jgi:hypothetical protein
VLGVIVLPGVGLAIIPVVREDHAAEAIQAGGAGVFLALVVMAFAAIVLGPSAARAAYLFGTFGPALLGAIFGWTLSWRRDFDALLDAELTNPDRRPSA